MTLNRINQLALLSSQYVVQRWLPRAIEADISVMRANSTPLIMVSPNGLDQYQGTVTSEDDVIYPVQVSIAFLQNQDSVANLATMLSWRNRIARALRFQKQVGLNGLASQMLTCFPKPGLVIDPDAFTNQNLLVSTYYFGYQNREPRGLNCVEWNHDQGTRTCWAEIRTTHRSAPIADSRQGRAMGVPMRMRHGASCASVSVERRIHAELRMPCERKDDRTKQDDLGQLRQERAMDLNTIFGSIS